MIRQDQYIRQTSIKMKINQTLEIKRLRSFQIMLIIQYCEKVSNVTDQIIHFNELLFLELLNQIHHKNTLRECYAFNESKTILF